MHTFSLVPYDSNIWFKYKNENRFHMPLCICLLWLRTFANIYSNFKLFSKQSCMRHTWGNLECYYSLGPDPFVCMFAWFLLSKFTDFGFGNFSAYWIPVKCLLISDVLFIKLSCVDVGALDQDALELLDCLSNWCILIYIFGYFNYDNCVPLYRMF